MEIVDENGNTIHQHEYNQESKRVAAGILGILLGVFGVHKFVLGYTKEGLTMLLVSVLTCGIGAIPMKFIAIIEGIIYLTKSDKEFIHTYQTNHKGWF